MIYKFNISVYNSKYYGCISRDKKGVIVFHCFAWNEI